MATVGNEFTEGRRLWAKLPAWVADIRDVPVIHSVLGVCRISHYSVFVLGKIISPSKFNFFKVKY